MNQVEAEQLRMEIAHIFESGANEIRIFEMVKSFIESRQQVNKLPIHIVIERAFNAGRERIPHPDWDFVYEDHEEYIKKHGL